MKKMWKKPLALLLAVMMLVTAAPLTFAAGPYICSNCGVERSYENGDAIPIEAKEPTSCAPNGYGYVFTGGEDDTTNGLACKVCGEVLFGKYRKDFARHDETKRTVINANPVGEEDGKKVHGNQKYYQCQDCNSFYIEKDGKQFFVTEDEMLIHAFGDWEETTPASCGVAGEETRTCQVEGCTAQETRPIEALEHDWNNYVITEAENHIATPATCTEKADYYKKCGNCGKYADEVEGAAENTFPGGEPAGHDALDTLEWVVINPETEAVIANAQSNCNTGFTRGKICSKCTKVILKETIPAGTDHQTVMVREKKATCLEDGVKAPGGFYCTVCSYKKAWEVDPAVGHHTEALQEGKAATCFEDGYEAYWICSVCEEELTEKVVIPKQDHDLTKVDAVAPTEGDPGTKEHWICSRPCCDGKKFIVKLGEDGNPVVEGGKTVYVEATDEELINCTHNWDEIEPDENESVAMTCLVDGLEVKICPVCRMRNETVLKAPGKHDIEGVEYTHEREPKCNTDGYYYKACKRCGEKVEEKFPQKTGQHNWETKDEYDCTKNTKITYICTICNESKVEQKATSPDGKHPDADDNGYCDLCGKQFCVCLCHNQEWYGKILYFFARVWWEFLSIRNTCACGKVHYEKSISVPTA